METLKVNISIYKYNNYFNRRFKKEDTLSAYGEPLLTTPLLNFNPADGINTSHVINYTTEIPTGDYLIVHDDGEIISRWFIIETKRLSSRQYRVLLHRDLIADNYDSIINAPAFIKKATLLANDVLTYNLEDMTVNQIKTYEKPIKDATGCSWYVGYYARNYNNAGSTLSGEIEAEAYFDMAVSQTYDEWITENGTKSANSKYVNIFQYYTYHKAANVIRLIEYESDASGTISNDITTPFSAPDTSKYPIDMGYTAWTNSQVKSALVNHWINLYNSVDNTLTNYTSDELDVLNMNDKIYRFNKAGGGYEYRKIHVNKTEKVITKAAITQQMPLLWAEMNKVLKELYTGTAQPTIYTWKYSVIYDELTVTSDVLSSGKINYNITTSRYNVAGQPYDIFAIPRENIVIKNTGSTWAGDKITSDASIGEKVIADIISKYNTTVLYDIQILPYCPVSEFTIDEIDLKNDNLRYSEIKLEKDGTTEVKGVILNANVNTFTFVKSFKIEVTNKKIDNQCDKYRLCSPNYNGQFEFSVAKNDGVNSLTIDCTYQPFTPYIHIAPDFKNLYGKSFGDARGLICGGDFGIATVTDNWQKYQIENKNYQNIFDRQIQNLEIQNKYQRTVDIVNALTGTLEGALAGGQATGTPIGAAGGATASLLGGIADIALKEDLRRENISYKRDMYGYQLGNIQALPYNLTRISAYNANNKIFPFVEKYTCTKKEKDALANKIAYNGMTVMVVGKISQYLQNKWEYFSIKDKGFIQAEMIRLEDISDDAHTAQAIYEELSRGIYFK